MNLRPAGRILASTLLAALSAFAVLATYVHEAKVHAVERALRLAEQISAQTEAVILVGKQHGESHPIEWATQLLSQSNQPRLIQFKRIDGTEKSAVQSAQVDWIKNEFHFRKLTDPEVNHGFELTIQLEVPKFLSKDSRGTQDATTAGLFAVFLTLFWTLLRPKSATASLDWIAGFKGLVVDQASHTRNMIKRAQCIAQTSRSAHQLIIPLKKSLEEIQDSIDPAFDALRLNIELAITEATEADETLRGLYSETQAMNQEISETMSALAAQVQSVEALKKSA